MDDPAVPLILVVDDDPETRAMLTDVLEDAGYTVESARDGAVAMALLRAEPTRFGLVLLDLMMPLVDGWLFRRMQLANPVIAAIPVVALSASTIVRNQGLPQGLSEENFLPKPSDIDAVLAVVARHLSPQPRSIEVAGRPLSTRAKLKARPLSVEWISTPNQLWVCVVGPYRGIITSQDMMWRARVETKDCMISAETMFARLDVAKAWVEDTIAGLKAQALADCP